MRSTFGRKLWRCRSSQTIACVRYGGEMYVETASASISAASCSGRTNQPTRRPGATVFEKEEQYAT